MPRSAVHRPFTPPGALLVTVSPEGVHVRLIGLDEAEGEASRALAERLAPQLAALDAAARRTAVRR